MSFWRDDGPQSANPYSKPFYVGVRKTGFSD
jgi:hypothetical protein